MDSSSLRENGLKLKIVHPRLVLGITCIFLIAFLRIALSINIPVLVFIVVCTIISFTLNKEELIAFLVSLIAFSSLFQYRYGIYIAALTLLYKERGEKTKYRYAVLLLIMMIWEVMHANISHLEPYGFLQEFSELIALFVVLMKPKRDYRTGLPMRTLAYSTVISCIINLIATVKFYGFSASALVRLGNVNRVETGDFMGIMNPNIAAFLCLLAVCGLLLLRQYDNESVGDGIIIGVLVVFMLLTQSRSALLCLILVYAMYAIWGFNKSKTINSSRVIGTLIGLLIISIIIPVFFGDTINALVARFDTADLSNGRFQIFAFYHLHLTRTPLNYLFGVGLYKYNATMQDLYGSLWQSFAGLARYDNGEIVYKVCHCNFQEVLVAWGIPGLIFIYLLIRSIIRHNRNTIEKVNYITLITILVFTIQFQFLTSGPVIIGLLFSLICIEYSPNQL